MKIHALLLFVTSLPLSAFVHADNLPVAADAPPAFKTECGSCHIAFPASLLTANDWRNIMAKLDKHYGDNASLDDKPRQDIEAFLVAHGGAGKKTSGAGDPPRITNTYWFNREHRKVPGKIWKDPTIASAANCGGCHNRASEGRFGEREIVMPGGKKQED